ncbi:MAG: hypothetical protein ACOC41_07870 [Chitinivibrionales bacterium]
MNINGRPVYLRNVAEVCRASGPVEIVRENQIKQVIVGADANGISIGEAVTRVRDAVAAQQKPADVDFEMGGWFINIFRTPLLILGQRNLCLTGFHELYFFIIR